MKKRPPTTSPYQLLFPKPDQTPSSPILRMLTRSPCLMYTLLPTTMTLYPATFQGQASALLTRRMTAMTQHLDLSLEP
jgi:hypothetical protein